jgi:response regulator NasT
MQGVNSELEQIKKKLSDRKLIERAKGIVMRQKQYTEDQAYREIRKSAMNQGKPMAELASRIIATFDEALD